MVAERGVGHPVRHIHNDYQHISLPKNTETPLLARGKTWRMCRASRPAAEGEGQGTFFSFFCHAPGGHLYDHEHPWSKLARLGLTLTVLTCPLPSQIWRTLSCPLQGSVATDLCVDPSRRLGVPSKPCFHSQLSHEQNRDSYCHLLLSHHDFPLSSNLHQTPRDRCMAMRTTSSLTLGAGISLRE